MTLDARDASAGVFVRGLTNLKAQLIKAEARVNAGGPDEATLLDARLAPPGEAGNVAGSSPYDLHAYPLAAHVHWAAEGARLAIAQLLGSRPVPEPSNARSFADLHERIDATITALQSVDATDLEMSLARTIVLEHRRGSVSASGSQFLLGYAIPHFHYHVTTAYGILRTQGVPLTMGDFLGDWGTS